MARNECWMNVNCLELCKIVCKCAPNMAKFLIFFSRKQFAFVVFGWWVNELFMSVHTYRATWNVIATHKCLHVGHTSQNTRRVYERGSALVYSQLVQSSVHRSQSIAFEVDQPHHFHWPLDSFRLSHFNHFNLSNALTSHNPHWIDSKMISQWKHRKRRSPTTASQSYTEQMTIAYYLEWDATIMWPSDSIQFRFDCDYQ